MRKEILNKKLSALNGIFFLAVLIILLIFIPSFVAAQAPKSETKPAPHVIGKKGISIVPDIMLRGYDPITVFFSSNRGPAEGGPLDKPGSLFKISPTHPGEYKWLDARTLQFLPTIPWPALKRYTVKVGGKSGKTFELVTLMAPPVHIIPATNSTNLDPVKEINLAFKAPIDPGQLSSMITFEIRPLPGVSTEKSYWLTARDFNIKELERRSHKDFVRYLVVLRKPVPNGKRMIMHLRLSADTGIKGSLARYTFSTKPLFRLTGVGSGSTIYPIASRGSVYTMEQAMDCNPRYNYLMLRFSDQLAAVSIQQVKQMVRFTPAVRNIRHDVSGNTIRLYFDADREKPYKLALKHVDIKNRFGRGLASFGPTSLYFFYRQSGPYLKWLAAQGILERYGPRVFPMEGRNMDQVDLRIYKLNPLNRNIWPFPNKPVVIDESNRPPGPGEEPAYASSLRQQIQLLGSPLVSKVVPLPLKTGTGMRFGIDLKKHLARISGNNRPGHYLVGYRVIGTGTKRYYVRVQVTDLSLSTVEEESAVNFVVTSLKTGLPVSSAAVKVEGTYKGKWKVFVKGTTNADGMFRHRHTGDHGDRVTRITVTSGSDMLVLDPKTPPPHFMNNHWYSSYSTWLNWLCSSPATGKHHYRYKAHILTERPIYRPEEEVHIKGYIRNRQDGKIKPYTGPRDFNVVVFGPGNKKWVYPVKLTKYDSFYHKFLEQNLPTGNYRAVLQRKSGSRFAEVSFKKESYRIPRFEIKLSSKDRVALDEKFEVRLTAGYYAGGPVVGQDVRWRVTPFQYFHSVPGYPGYLFSSSERFSGGRGRASYGVITKSDVTDENGSATIEIDPTKEDDGRSRRYVVEATVRGADEQTVTSTRRVLALSPFVLGLKLERIVKKDMTIKPEVLVVGHDDKPLAGKKYHVKLMQRQWHSYLQESDFTTGKAKYVTDVVDHTVFEEDRVSGDTPEKLSIRVKEAGIYVVEISSRDKQGRLQKVVADLYVAGDTPVSWKKPKANVFDTTADKRSYNPGDTAKIILKSPFQDARALAVVEGPTGNTYHWVAVKNGQAMFNIAIKGDMTPRMPVHFLLLRGRLPGKSRNMLSGKQDRAKPIAMANTVWLRVNPRDNRLTLDMEHKKTYLPGSEASIKIKMTDPDGKPLNGEVTLWLVDRAVLALGKEKRLNPLSSFIDAVNSLIRIRETRNQVVGNLSAEEIAGGDGVDGGVEGGVMGEAALFERVTVRKNFKTTPYFKPNIIVTNGVATVTFKLPDNLTDFAVRAIGVDRSGARFGSVKSMVSIRLPLIIQSALPRFVRPGDTFMAGGIGRVVEGEGGPGRAELQVTGLNVDHGDPAKDKSKGKLPLQWVVGKPEQVYFPLSVPKDAASKKEKEVTVRLAVIRNEDEAMDAFEVKLPIRPDTAPRRFEKFVALKPGLIKKFPEPLEKVRPGTMKQELAVTTEPALVKMLSGMNYLARYPHGCLEQRISRLMPELVLMDTMSLIGRDVHTNEIKQMMDEMFVYLGSVQGSDGMYSYWPGSRRYVNLTAYVLEFLYEAKKRGYHFEPKLFDRAASALKNSLHTDYSGFISGHSYFERVEAMAALAKTGYFDDAYAHDIMVRAESMNLFSESRVLYAFLLQKNPYQKAVNRLSADLRKSLIFKLRDGKEKYAGLQYRARSWGGAICSSETRTVAGVTRALFKAEPENPRNRVLIEELVSLGTNDGWGSTAANAAALLTLGDVLRHKQPDSKQLEVEATFGSEKKSLETGEKAMVRISSANETPGQFKLLTEGLKTPPMAWLSMTYTPDGTGDTMKARSDGFVVSRRLLVYKDEKSPPAKHDAKAGETLTLDMGTIVEEHIRVINAEDRFYVAIQAPFAAGFEPMNPNLATSPPEAKPTGTFTKQPDYALYADDSVTFYFDQLPKGTYDFYFRLRTAVQGSFAHPPAKAELMYQLPVRGNSDGIRIVVLPRSRD